jgi:toxin-antitoxin system PIN domain toxin
VRPYLLDINVLLALTWPSHVLHSQAQEWFVRNRAAGFRTCPLTEIGFVRISSNPSFTSQAVSPPAAMSLLKRITSMSGHEFWPDDLEVSRAIPVDLPLADHRQITDAHLVALAASRGGVLATLDRGVLAVAGDNEKSVELV